MRKLLLNLIWVGFQFFFFLGVSAQTYPVLTFQKFFGKGGNDTPTSLVKSADNNILIGGIIEENDGQSGCTNLYIVKVDPQGKMLWEREIGGSGCDEMRGMAATPDSGVIFAGITSSFIGHVEKGDEAYQGDYFIGKLNYKGEIEWLKTYGGIDVDQAFGIAKGKYDEYVVCGTSRSTNFDVETDLLQSNLFALRVNANGEKKSGYAFGGEHDDWAYSVAGCQNGDFLLAGFTNSEDIDGTNRRANGDGWVLKITPTGYIRWQRIYSGKFEDYFTDVIEDRDQRVILVGNFETEEDGKQFWFLKLAPNGQKIYEKIFGGSGNEFLTAVNETENPFGYIMAGYSVYNAMVEKHVKGGEDFWLIRTDEKGNVIWKQTYGGRDDERGVDVIEFEPGVFYALGEKVNDFGQKSRKKDFWLIRVDEKSCEDNDISVYMSIKDYTTTAKTNIKFRPLVNYGDAFLWDFGDGTISREKEPIHSFNLPGVYEVKLTVFFNDNCVKTYVVPEYLMVW